MDELVKFKVSIETHLLKQIESTAADLDTSERHDVYGVVVTLWGTNIVLLQSLERHAKNALTEIIRASGNVSDKRVSRRRFSDTDCSVEVSAVPIVEGPRSRYFSDKKLARVTSTSGETVLNHEIVKLFVNGVVSGGYTFHGIRRLSSTPIDIEVLRLAIAIKHDPSAPAAAPTGGGEAGDDDDDDNDDDGDGEEVTRPKYVRPRSQKSQNAQLQRQLKEKAKKAKRKPARKKGKDTQDPGSSSSNAKPAQEAPATTEPDDEDPEGLEVTFEELFGEEEEEDQQTNGEDDSEEEDQQTKELRGLLMLEENE